MLFSLTNALIFFFQELSYVYVAVQLINSILHKGTNSLYLAIYLLHKSFLGFFFILRMDYFFITLTNCRTKLVKGGLN